MKNGKRKISSVIAVRLFIAVFVAFLASSSLTYLLLYENCESSAKDMLKYNSITLSIDIECSTEQQLYEYGNETLQCYIDGDKESLSNFFDDMNYSYLANIDGTIFISGNKDFIGKNVRDIEFISSMLDYLDSNVQPDSYYGDITPKTVKTLDGKMELYYVVTVSGDCPDVVCLQGYDKKTFDQFTEYAGQALSLNRVIGMTGYNVAIDLNNIIIGATGDDLFQTEFPYPELIKQYELGTDERILVETSDILFMSEHVESKYKFMIGKQELWGQKCFFCLNKQKNIYLLSVYPESEAMSQAYDTIFLIVIIEIIVFTVLFIVLNWLVKRRIVRKLDAVNSSLTEITNGNLDERVDINDTYEFELLSEDINNTVDRLKEYIAEAAARLDADLAVAKAIQTSALPNVFPPYPDRKEFELFASMNAAKEVGGDFYDFYMLNSHTLGILIADVSGKSIPGAMFMMTAKTVIKSFAESGLPPAEVFTMANEKLCEGNEAEMFVTAWLGYLDLGTGLVRVANAGHNPPLLIHDGKAEYLVLKPGLMLAGMDGVRYKEQTIQLEKGDILYLYTDGVTEAMDQNEEQYGEERLKKLLSFGNKYSDASPEDEIVKSICYATSEDIENFTNGAEQSDDITMLCVRFFGEETDMKKLRKSSS